MSIKDSNNNTDILNTYISIEEVRKTVMKAKNFKSSGYDNIPNEVLKSNTIISALHSLFNYIFNSGYIPNIWLKAIINPIPKPGFNPNIPLQYRGISILSCVFKIFTSIINSRISKFLETNKIYADEQNGFRKGRSCQDHIFALNSLVNNKLKTNNNIYACYIDLKSAFDLVNRKLLFWKLYNNGIEGNIMRCIKNIYSRTHAAVRINENLTNWFRTPLGVLQGDSLSPILFSLYINDLLLDLERMKGVDIDGVNKSVLAYADDLILFSEDESSLQDMLNYVTSWCKKWRLVVNTKKTKIMHFRNVNTQQSTYEFKINEETLEYVDNYKYLGVIMNENMKYDSAIKRITDSAGRALGSIINKAKSYRDIGASTFTTLYQRCVSPIMCYGAGVWGSHRDAPKLCHNIQKRAIRYYLGVHRFTPIDSIQGDMGWISIPTTINIEILRLWNRMIKTKIDTTKLLFNYEINLEGKWSKNVLEILKSIGQEDAFYHKSTVNLKFCQELMLQLNQQEWINACKQKPKLRTYIKFKQEYKMEKYISFNFTKYERSLCAQFRSGILPLRIEVGRYRQEQVEERICDFCPMNEIEDEEHFIFDCPLYAEEREILFKDTNLLLNQHITRGDILYLLFENHTCKIVRYIKKAYDKRKEILYKS